MRIWYGIGSICRAFVADCLREVKRVSVTGTLRSIFPIDLCRHVSALPPRLLIARGLLFLEFL